MFPIRSSVVVRVTCAVFSLFAVVAAATPEGDAIPLTLRLAPSPLLAIDQHRMTVIERIVGTWGEALSRSDAGIASDDLRDLLGAMRADQLLAASLAGSLEGLRDVVSAAIVGEQDLKASLIQAKALGDPNQDLVYVPVTPCRLVDTRAPYAAVYQNGGAFAPNQVRTYTLQGGSGVCLTQLPASAMPSAVQLEVFGIPTTSGSGDIEILPQGGAFGASATLVYLGNNAFTSGAATSPVNLANKQISVQVRGGGAHLAIDVVGYFRAPAGGYVSSVTAGTGLTGGTITSSGTIAVNTAVIQARVSGACAAGSSIRTVNADGTVACEADDNSGGTVTSVGSGSGLTGGPITTSGTLAADTTYLQRRVSSSCAVGSSIRAIAADGSVACQTDSIGAANAYVQGGNAFGMPAVLGTSDNQTLDIIVGKSRVMRYEPDITSPNVIGGSGHNSVASGVSGAAIAGGGVQSGTLDPSGFSAGPNSVTSSYGVVGGGFGNRAGISGTKGVEYFATVGGGANNAANAEGSVVAGGAQNATYGLFSTVIGGYTNNAVGNYSAVAGGAYNSATGYASFAAGMRASPETNHCFVFAGWTDGTTVSCLGASSMVRFAFDHGVSIDYFSPMPNGGGNRFVYIGDLLGHAITAYNGAYLSDAGVWTNSSDVAVKEDFAEIDSGVILERVAALPVRSWRYIADPEGVRRIGPTAQDFKAAFNLGIDDKTIGTVDADGVALAAIQGLNAKLEARMAEQSQEIASLRRQVELLMSRAAREDRVATMQ